MIPAMLKSRSWSQRAVTAGRVYAREALKLMMAYGMEALHLHRFYAKIGEATSCVNYTV